MTDKPFRSLEPGAIIGGRYRILHDPPPAIGGFAEVYCAEELGDELNSKVAVKILKADRSCDPQLVDRFKQEGDILGSINARNVVRIRARVPHDDGRNCLIMDWLSGPTLLEYLKERPNDMTRFDLAEGMCRGIEVVHEKGLVHGDIKPSNIIIEEFDDGLHPVLIDFGVSWDAKRGTGTGYTLKYAAPEQLEGDCEIGKPVDIYSLGAVLFYLFSGQYYLDVPSDASDEQLKEHILNGTIQKLGPVIWHELRPISDSLEYLIRSMLARDPGERPDIAGVQQELKRIREVMEKPSPTTTATRSKLAKKRALVVRAAQYNEVSSSFEYHSMPLSEVGENRYMTPDLYWCPYASREIEIQILDKDSNFAHVAHVDASTVRQPFTITVTFNTDVRPDWQLDPGGHILRSYSRPLDSIMIPDVPSTRVDYPLDTDLLFILDGTMGKPEFDRAKGFIEAVVQFIEQNQRPVRLGLISYGEHPDYPKWARSDLAEMPEPMPFDSVAEFWSYLQYRLPEPGKFRVQDYCDALELALWQAATYDWVSRLRYLVVIGNSPPHPPGDLRALYKLLDWTSDQFKADLDWRDILPSLSQKEVRKYSVWVKPVSELPLTEGMREYASTVWAALNDLSGNRPEIFDEYSIKQELKRITEDIWGTDAHWQWRFEPEIRVPISHPCE